MNNNINSPLGGYYPGYIPQSMPSQGWVCPKCGRVYSPTTSMCFTCGGNQYIPPYATSGLAQQNLNDTRHPLDSAMINLKSGKITGGVPENWTLQKNPIQPQKLNYTADDL